MENPAELTKRVLLLRLINAIIDMAASRKTQIVTNISSQCLSEKALTYAQEVEKRMRPDEEKLTEASLPVVYALAGVAKEFDSDKISLENKIPTQEKLPGVVLLGDDGPAG